ncbi:MAG TPA: membrane protein insertion efficiency factor YidD [Polyangiaceae bacterium]|nr:membrane protein insertion efficiency factor YidD [Polyangiaceae bacterium]
MKRVVLVLLRGYQLLLSPLLGGQCRFEPSCSRYAMACVEHHGVLSGLGLALRRLARCHPWNPGGWDPPPLPPHVHGPSCGASPECSAAALQTR